MKIKFNNPRFGELLQQKDFNQLAADLTVAKPDLIAVTSSRRHIQSVIEDLQTVAIILAMELSQK